VVLARLFLFPGVESCASVHLIRLEGRSHVGVKVRGWGGAYPSPDTPCRVPGRYLVGGPASFLSLFSVSLDPGKPPLKRALIRGGCETAPYSASLSASEPTFLRKGQPPSPRAWLLGKGHASRPLGGIRAACRKLRPRPAGIGSSRSGVCITRPRVVPGA